VVRIIHPLVRLTHRYCMHPVTAEPTVVGTKVLVNNYPMEVSSAGESHPDALSEPYLNLSAHTAPAMEPRRTPICQCAHNFGSRLEIRATQCVALRKCPRSFLYFWSAQRANDRSSCRIGGYSADR